MSALKITNVCWQKQNGEANTYINYFIKNLMNSIKCKKYTKSKFSNLCSFDLVYFFWPSLDTTQNQGLTVLAKMSANP